MTEDTKELPIWILAALLVGVVFFEEARFGRRQNDRPSFPAPAAQPADPSGSESSATIAEFTQTGLPD